MNKVCFLTRDLDYGGSQRQLVTLVKALDKQGIDTTVLCFYAGGLLTKDLENSGVKVISIEKRGRWDLSSFYGRLIQHLKFIQPDILHGYLSSPNILAVLVKPVLPSIQIVWGVRSSNVDFSRYDWRWRLLFQLECLFSRFVDLIIVNSNAGRSYHLSHGFPADRMVVIPNGIDTERFKPDPQARSRVRAEWGISSDIVLIGLVGRLDPIKDYPNFLNAAALLCRERHDIYFVCVGDGPESYARELHQLTETLGISEKVIWAGVRSDMPAVYNAFDIAASTSYSEGFSNAIAEAMACRLPCVVTDVGDSAWIVSDAGIVVPPQNSEALAAGWISCLEMDRDTMGQKARSRIVEKFSVDSLAKRTLEEICSLSCTS